MADEQLQQVIRLQIPRSKAELKHWVISRTRADVRWIKRHPGDLVLYSFEKDTGFLNCHLIPGGAFVFLPYAIRDVSLTKISKSEITGELYRGEISAERSWTRVVIRASGSLQKRLTDARCLRGGGDEKAPPTTAVTSEL